MTDAVLRAFYILFIPALGAVLLAGCSASEPELIPDQQSAPCCGS